VEWGSDGETFQWSGKTGHRGEGGINRGHKSKKMERGEVFPVVQKRVTHLEPEECKGQRGQEMLPQKKSELGGVKGHSEKGGPTIKPKLAAGIRQHRTGWEGENGETRPATVRERLGLTHKVYMKKYGGDG